VPHAPEILNTQLLFVLCRELSQEQSLYMLSIASFFSAVFHPWLAGPRACGLRGRGGLRSMPFGKILHIFILSPAFLV
jgi:hypothetical protein